jgi:hypothetical protein
MPEQQRLRQMLEQLHTELRRAPALDDLPAQGVVLATVAL